MKTAMSIDELIEAGPLKRTSIYAAIRSGNLKARKFGRRTFILVADYEDFLRKLPTLRTRKPSNAGGLK